MGKFVCHNRASICILYKSTIYLPGLPPQEKNKLCFINFSEWQISIFRLEQIFRNCDININILLQTENVNYVSKDKKIITFD